MVNKHSFRLLRLFSAYLLFAYLIIVYVHIYTVSETHGITSSSEKLLKIR